MPHRYTSSAPDVITSTATEQNSSNCHSLGFVFANKGSDSDSNSDSNNSSLQKPKPYCRTPSQLAHQLLSRSATVNERGASEAYAKLDIHRELQHRFNLGLNRCETFLDKSSDNKSNFWNSIKRKMSMTSLASNTISSFSSATKKTKKSSFSSLERESEKEKDEKSEQVNEHTETPINGPKRSATVSHSIATQTRKPVHRKKVAADDTAIDGSQHKARRPPSSLLLGFFDPDHGIAIGRYNISPKKTLSKTERKKTRKKDSCDYFYEPNTALAIGKFDDCGTFPQSPLKSPLFTQRTTKHKDLSNSNVHIEETLPLCESEPKGPRIRRKFAMKVKQTETEEMVPPASKRIKMRNKLAKSKQSKTYKRLNRILNIFETKVVEYLKKRNRPYSASDISTNLGQSVSKLATQKVLVACAERGVITSKAYGKQTVFVANQNDDTNAISPEDLAALVENNDHLRKEHQKINVMKKLPAFNELPSLIGAHKKRIGELDLQIADVKDFNDQVSQQETAKVEKEFIKWKKLYKKRMRKYSDVRDALCGEEATKEDVTKMDEELGLDELDDDCKMLLALM